MQGHRPPYAHPAHARSRATGWSERRLGSGRDVWSPVFRDEFCAQPRLPECGLRPEWSTIFGLFPCLAARILGRPWPRAARQYSSRKQGVPVVKGERPQDCQAPRRPSTRPGGIRLAPVDRSVDLFAGDLSLSRRSRNQPGTPGDAIAYGQIVWKRECSLAGMVDELAGINLGPGLLRQSPYAGAAASNPLTRSSSCARPSQPWGMRRCK